ncbi:hypothetical protein [Paracoccus litorisediminis]|uniref:Twin-arginine translocation signal domain-containing protein n=1 Tax=Paracoccus litorisediminis TaxID=2006130 RepID=A0A844HJ92_9RHOB|nr:hypothetical protein [Paracoccus litorisediminis]MTH57871.1 hypothetical protein [Paracoccus litorisediminis]
MKRRDLMKLAPAALAASAAPSLAAQAMSETPIMRMYRQWTVLMSKENGALDMEEEAFDALVSMRCDYEDQMMREPCQNATDWVIKVAVWTAFGEFELSSAHPHRDAIWAEARAQIGGAA